VVDFPDPDGAFYHWAATPGDDETFARELFRATNITLLPGTYLARDSHSGNPGRGRVRIAWVAPEADCVAAARTIAEFVLPILGVLGLFTRLAALGMIGFIAVQSLTDLYGHGGIEHAATLGAWFDRLPDGLILDQRAFWVFLLFYLVIRGGGALSADRALGLR